MQVLSTQVTIVRRALRVVQTFVHLVVVFLQTYLLLVFSATTSTIYLLMVVIQLVTLRKVIHVRMLALQRILA